MKNIKKNSVLPRITKLVINNKCAVPSNDYFVKLKTLEYADLKSLENIKIALSITNKLRLERLNNTAFSNKQRKEIELISSIEAFKVVDSLIRSIESSINE